MTAGKLWLPFLLFVLLAAAGVYFGVSAPADAQSGLPSGALYGWAWSSNIGWIKFRNSTNEQPFGVIVNNGVLSGSAWSSNIGWVSFDRAAGTGPDGVTGANVSGSSGHLVGGWARACSIFASGCSGSLKDNLYRGDWDGWLKLGGGTLTGGSAGGVTLEGNQFKGFAWGGLILGWVKFDGVRPADENGCTGVCLSGQLAVTCSVSPSGTVTPGQNVTITATVVGGQGPYRYNWRSDPPGYFPDDEDENANSVTGSYAQPGTYQASVTVVDMLANNAVCPAVVVEVGNANQRRLEVQITGDGAVTGPGISCQSNGGSQSGDCTELFNTGTEVVLTADPSATNTWGGCDSVVSGQCRLTMNTDRTVTATFGALPDFDLVVSYGPGRNSMRVNYQTQNLDQPHDSSTATIAITDADGDTSNNNLPVTLRLLVNLIAGRAPNCPSQPVVKYNGQIRDSISLLIGQEAELAVHFPSDCQEIPNTASPYAGNYRLPVTATAGPVTKTSSVNFSYIDLREREQ